MWDETAHISAEMRGASAGRDGSTEEPANPRCRRVAGRAAVMQLAHHAYVCRRCAARSPCLQHAQSLPLCCDHFSPRLHVVETREAKSTQVKSTSSQVKIKSKSSQNQVKIKSSQNQVKITSRANLRVVEQREVVHGPITRVSKRHLPRRDRISIVERSHLQEWSSWVTSHTHGMPLPTGPSTTTSPALAPSTAPAALISPPVPALAHLTAHLP